MLHVHAWCLLVLISLLTHRSTCTYNIHVQYECNIVTILIKPILCCLCIQESYSYTDPVTELVECLCLKFDFDKAQEKLAECEKVSCNSTTHTHTCFLLTHSFFSVSKFVANIFDACWGPDELCPHNVHDHGSSNGCARWGQSHVTFFWPLSVWFKHAENPLLPVLTVHTNLAWVFETPNWVKEASH